MGRSALPAHGPVADPKIGPRHGSYRGDLGRPRLLAQIRQPRLTRRHIPADPARSHPPSKTVPTGQCVTTRLLLGGLRRGQEPDPIRPIVLALLIPVEDQAANQPAEV